MEASGKENNITINGSGSITGGKYGDVRINGSGEINGDVECASLTINGSGAVKGALKAGQAAFNGSGTVQGPLQADTVQVHGAASLKGDVTTREIDISGAVSVHGNVSTEQAKCAGAFSVSGDFNAEKFEARGGFKIDGLLNAGEIDICLHGDCRAREIGGSSISVRLDTREHWGVGNLFRGLLPNHHHHLVTDSIEGDEISLENTQARVVRGKRVTIGPGCDIALVEYTERYQQDEGAQVTEQRQV